MVFKVQIEIKQEDFCTRGKEKKNIQECHTVQAHTTTLYVLLWALLQNDVLRDKIFYAQNL